MQHILVTYGYKSRERITMKEEITSMYKQYESDMKRLRGFLNTYEEKKEDLSKHELDQRQEILNHLKEALNILKYDFDD